MSETLHDLITALDCCSARLTDMADTGELAELVRTMLRPLRWSAHVVLPSPLVPSAAMLPTAAPNAPTQMIWPLHQQQPSAGTNATGDGVIGWLFLAPTDRPSTPDDAIIGRIVARWVSDALQRMVLQSETSRQQEAIAMLSTVGRDVMASLDLDVVLTNVLDATCRHLDSEAASVILLDPFTGELVFVATGPQNQGAPVREMRLPPGKGIAGWVVSHGQPLVLPDVRNDARWYADVDRQSNFATTSLMCVPLRSKGAIIGVLEAVNRRRDSFHDRDLPLMEALANWAAAAIDNARLYGQLRARADASAILLRVGEATSTTLELSEILKRVAQLTMDGCAVTACAIVLTPASLGDNGGSLPTVSLARRQQGLTAETDPALRAAGQSLLALVRSYGGRDPIVLSGPQITPPLQALTAGARHLLVTPLIYWDVLAGALILSSQSSDSAMPFSEQQVNLASAIARQTAIAIANARLFEETRRALRELRTLHAMALDVAAELDLPDVLQRVVARAASFLNASGGAIYLLDSTNERLVEATFQGMRTPGVAPRAWRLGEGLIGQVAVDGLPLVNHTAPTGAAGQVDSNSLQVAVPLKWENQVMGVLFVWYNTLDRLGYAPQEAVRLLDLFAPHAALSIRNGQLYHNLQAHMNDLQRTQAQLIQAGKLAAVGRLTASLAHEVNNPLQAIQSCLQLGMSDRLSLEKRRNYLEMTQNEVARLIAIMRRLLDVHRPSHDTATWVALPPVVESVLALVVQQLEKNRIVVQTDWAPGLPPVWAVADYLKQVFLNLVLNAADAMPDGGALTISAQTADAAVPAVSVCVTDTGVGIAPADLPNIFEPFFTTKHTGSGLGLSVVYGIVETCGGTLNVESTLGAGTTFILTLPGQARQVSA